jgi:hypothetical protein
MLVTQSEVGRNDEEVGSSSGVSEAVEIIEINDIFVDSPLDITWVNWYKSQKSTSYATIRSLHYVYCNIHKHTNLETFSTSSWFFLACPRGVCTALSPSIKSDKEVEHLTPR